MSRCQIRFAALFSALCLLSCRLPATAQEKEDGGGRAGIQLASEDDQVVVKGVVKDSPAAKAGLKEGDIIVKVNDKEIKTVEETVAAVIKHKPGDKVKLKFKRDGKEQEIEVTLAKASDLKLDN